MRIERFPFQTGTPMKTSMLDYYEQILDKVSFDYDLFRKEYRKAMHTLKPEDAQRLHQWIKDKGFSHDPVKIRDS